LRLGQAAFPLQAGHHTLQILNLKGCRPAEPIAANGRRPFFSLNITQRDVIMSSSIEEITVNYTEDGVQVVQETGKEILSKGAWTTILFRYRNLDRASGTFGKELYSVRRYQKRQGEYLLKSKFNISSTEQAKKLRDILTVWIAEAEKA
jgi:hypothetical protein